MPQTIVVPLSNAAHGPDHVADAALPYAEALAARTGANLVLVSAVDVAPTVDLGTRSLMTPSAAERRVWLDETQQRLDHIATRLDEERVKTVVRWGNPVDSVLAILADYPDPVLVLASHARGGVERLLVGSIAFQLVRAASCPVLVVRGSQPLAPEHPVLSKILVPLDQSTFAEHALDAGLAALGPADLQLHLLYVVEMLPYAVMAPADLVAMIEPKVRRYLEEVAQPLLERGYRVTTEVGYGRPAAEIAHVASTFGADLIVMATHGRGGLNRIIFGSVAERLLHETSVPLFLVRPDEAAHTAEAERTADATAHHRVSETVPPALWRKPVREVMSAPPIVAHLGTPLADIVRTMLAQKIGSVLIVDDEGQLAGVVIESDFAGDDPAIPLAAYQVAQLFQPLASEAAIQQIQQAGGDLTAAQIMSHPVETVSEDESLGVVVRSMLERGIDQVPVVRNGVPVGIVARHDLLRLLLPEEDRANSMTGQRG